VGSGPEPAARRIVDLGARAVVPGFVDSHIHFFQTGLDRLHVDLHGATTLDEVMARLEGGARAKPGWVYANSFEEDLLGPGAKLTAADLDQAFPVRPVWINRIDYHSAIVNTAALRRLAIPLGTRGVVLDGGRPNGVLRAEAYMQAKALIVRNHPLWMREAAVSEAVHACVARGITAVHALEGGPLFGDEGVHALLRRMDRLPIDVTLFLQERNVYFTERLGFNHLGGCILIDGSIGSYTAAVAQRYPGGQGQGILYETARSLYTFVDPAHRAGAQLAFHAIGPRAIQVVLDAYARALDKTPRYDHRHRVEHFELATDAQIERAAALGVVVAMQPSFEHFWGGPHGMYADRLGEAWRDTNRLRDILTAGLRIAGGSDANVTPPDPLLGMHAAVHHPNPAQRLTPTEALRMMTLDAAYAAFNDPRHGSIEPGKEASFAVLDADPITCPPDTLSTIRVLETWSRGRRVHRAGEADPAWEAEEAVP
jgi:predicted amidohydrolase YtcJ